MLYYSGLMLLIMCFGGISKIKNKKEYLYIVGLLLSVISGLRHFTVGVDSMQYYYSYKMISRLPWDGILNTRYEAGYAIMCKLLSRLSENQQFLFFATSIFINGTIIWFVYKYSKNYWLSIYLYVSLGFYYNTMNILRQSLAMCIVLLGIPLLLKGKKIWFILVVLLASQFHSSAIVVLLLPIALEIKEQKKIFYGALLIGLMGFISGEYIFEYLSSVNERYSAYTRSNFAFTNYFATAINASIALVILIFYLYTKGFRINNRKYFVLTKNNFNVEGLYLSVLMLYFVFELIAMKANIFERLTTYYSIFCIIILPNTLKSIEKLQYKKWFLIFIITFTYLENMIILYFRPYWTHVIPYKFFK